jgi:glycyl-tRNA synthetase
LTQHAKHSGIRLVAEKKLAQPKMIDVVEAHLDKTSSKKLNKKETKQITAYLDQLTPEEIIRLEDRIKPLGQE